MNKEEYAIVDNEGNYITAPNETGGGRYISLMTKKLAELNVKAYYDKCKIKKIKVL